MLLGSPKTKSSKKLFARPAKTPVEGYKQSKMEFDEL